jgi:hypothetical protein
VDDLGDAVLSMPMRLDKLAIAFRFLQRIEILALDILDQRDFRGRRIVDLAYDCRDGVQLGPLRGAPAALARNNQEPFAVRSQQDRLEHAPLANRFCELLKRLLVEQDAWLVRIAGNPRDLDLAYAAAAGRLRCLRRRPRRFADQRLEPHAQAL